MYWDTEYSFNLYNSPTALPWACLRGRVSDHTSPWGSLPLPVGRVGIAFSQFQVGQNTKFRLLALRPK
jgi:hypothetical protein